MVPRSRSLHEDGFLLLFLLFLLFFLFCFVFCCCFCFFFVLFFCFFILFFVRVLFKFGISLSLGGLDAVLGYLSVGSGRLG